MARTKKAKIYTRDVAQVIHRSIVIPAGTTVIEIYEYLGNLPGGATVGSDTEIILQGQF